jgi:hypothetical protein
VAGVEAGETVYLVPISAVLVARLQQLPPDGVEGLVVLQQQPRVTVLDCFTLCSQQCKLLFVLQQRFWRDLPLLESPVQPLDLRSAIEGRKQSSYKCRPRGKY